MAWPENISTTLPQASCFKVIFTFLSSVITRSKPLSKVGEPDPINQVRTDICLLSEERMAVKNGYFSHVKISYQGN
jgi:hypothetical protein